MTATTSKPQADALAETTELCPSKEAISNDDIICQLETYFSNTRAVLYAAGEALVSGDLLDAESVGRLISFTDIADREVRDAGEFISTHYKQIVGLPLAPTQGIAQFNEVNGRAEFDRAFGSYTMATCMVDQAPRDDEDTFDRLVDVQTDAVKRMIATAAWSPSDIMRKVEAIIKETGGTGFDDEPWWTHVMADLDRLARRGA